MRCLFIDQSVDVEDGIRKHFHLSKLFLIFRCSVQSEMVVVDDVAYFWWQVKESERWLY